MAKRARDPATSRDRGARELPPLQTNNGASRNARYSFMDTPVEMQRPTFEQFSPPNSTIDESPASPGSPSRALPAYIQGIQGSSHAPLEKAQAQPPREMHPAYFAPYREDVPAQQAKTAPVPTVQQPPGPIPMKSQEVGRTPTAASIHQPNVNQAPTPHEQVAGVERWGTYNPNSFAGPNGPNVGPENHQPGQVSHPNAMVEPKWKHGLCEPDIICCMGIFCPCMVYSKTMYRLSRRTQKQDPTDLLGYESCNGSCGLFAVACGFQWVLATCQRTRVRKAYHLEGSITSDCLTSLCCYCCVVMQDEREVKDREELIRRHAGPASGYVAPGEMTYAPPPR